MTVMLSVQILLEVIPVPVNRSIRVMDITVQVCIAIIV